MCFVRKLWKEPGGFVPNLLHKQEFPILILFVVFIQDMSLEEDFRKAADRVKKLKSSPTEDEMLEIYALYKQALVGDCNIPKPGIFDLKGKFKWEAWNQKKGLDKESAKKLYVCYVQGIVKKYDMET